MANEAQKREIKDKVRRLVGERFGGDWDRAFRSYAQASGTGGLIDRLALLSLLEDAGIGNGWTRGMWADGIVKEIDTSNDGQLSMGELRLLFDGNN